MDMQLTGKRALVTGSSSGIGEGVARMLAAEGCRVVVHGRDAARAEAVARAIGAAGVALGDLSTDAGADAAAAMVKGLLGGVDILVNNAGGGTRDPGGLSSTATDWLDVDIATWVRTYEGNTVAAARMIHHFVPGMKAAGWGRVIQIASAVGVQPNTFGPDYSSAKAGMINMAVGLAKSLTGTGITVNTVSPGVIRTPGVERASAEMAIREGWGDIGPEEREKRWALERLKLPVGRIGRVEDIGAAVCLLASPLGGFITGADLHVDGGQVHTMY
jgi:NAD(P)-dependent dehydrogenase (short-subunit alcohol dehydrogenase family)